MPDLPAYHLALLLGFGGTYVDNPGLTLRVEAGADAPGWLAPLGVEVGAGYLHYGTLAAFGIGRIPLGDEDRAAVVLGLGWAMDFDTAGDAGLRVHHLLARVGLEATLTDAWFVSGELVPVRFPIAGAQVLSDGTAADLPVDATDAVFLEAGVALGYRF